MVINFTPLSLKAGRAVLKLLERDIADAHLRLSMGSIGAMLSDEVISRRNRDLATFKGLLNGEKSTPWKEKEEMTQWFESALVFLRDMLVIKVEPDTTLLINSDKIQELRDLSKTIDARAIVELYEKMLGLMNYFIFNINKSIVINYVRAMLENAFTKRPSGTNKSRG
ncbi:DNA polymerase III, subunits gamma and tau [Candidatus Magnetobacterium bavaricum]|uniref:DNA polymerase III, subunits gamma and tau n=1 Tax=Candidatus Magnetobacterium bavaricum TaxID=29290 RepID=A0A0F3GV77_9BACT|nr:DNA polymerase III, subunits gamma and tau [Candidatus Magnetobacterium bavaricum]